MTRVIRDLYHQLMTHGSLFKMFARGQFSRIMTLTRVISTRHFNLQNKAVMAIGELERVEKVCVRESGHRVTDTTFSV